MFETVPFKGFDYNILLAVPDILFEMKVEMEAGIKNEQSVIPFKVGWLK